MFWVMFWVKIYPYILVFYLGMKKPVFWQKRVDSHLIRYLLSIANLSEARINCLIKLQKPLVLGRSPFFATSDNGILLRNQNYHKLDNSHDIPEPLLLKF